MSSRVTTPLNENSNNNNYLFIFIVVRVYDTCRRVHVRYTNSYTRRGSVTRCRIHCRFQRAAGKGFYLKKKKSFSAFHYYFRERNISLPMRCRLLLNRTTILYVRIIRFARHDRCLCNITIVSFCNAVSSTLRTTVSRTLKSDNSVSFLLERAKRVLRSSSPDNLSGLVVSLIL